MEETSTRLAHLIEERIGMQAKLSIPRIAAMLETMAPAARQTWSKSLLDSQPDDPSWLDFIEDIFNHETFFFRHPRQLQHLAENVLPDLIRARRQRGETRFRVWCAGCSSGEEVHSIALLVRQSLASPEGGGVGQWDLEFLGTDLSSRILDTARRGHYVASPGLNSFRDIPDYAQDWFRAVLHEGCDVWSPDPNLARRMRFLPHNLTCDPPPLGDVDLVLCRNILIYFNLRHAHAAIATLAQALRPGGILVLGPADGLREAPGLEMVCDPQAVVWRKREAA